MFKCLKCMTSSPPGVRTSMVVVETRAKNYPSRDLKKDPGGNGREIVKEIRVCGSCASALTRAMV